MMDSGSARHKIKVVETYQIATILRGFSKKGKTNHFISIDKVYNNVTFSFQVFKWNEITFPFKPLSHISDW